MKGLGYYKLKLKLYLIDRLLRRALVKQYGKKVGDFRYQCEIDSIESGNYKHSIAEIERILSTTKSSEVKEFFTRELEWLSEEQRKRTLMHEMFEKMGIPINQKHS